MNFRVERTAEQGFVPSLVREEKKMGYLPFGVEFSASKFENVEKLNVLNIPSTYTEQV